MSVSETDDADKLGFPHDIMDRALDAVLAPLVSDGARIAYGGSIERPHNYTLVISSRLGEAYRRLDVQPGTRPFIHFIPYHRILATPAETFLEHLRQLAPYGEAWIVVPDGHLQVAAAVNTRPPGVTYVLRPFDQSDPNVKPDYFTSPAELVATVSYQQLQRLGVPPLRGSFTEMRAAMASACDARVVVGGRRTGFGGPVSGVSEEALLTIRDGKPLAVLGGFGGSARDIAIALGLIPTSQSVPIKAAADREAYESGLRALQDSRPAFEATAAADLPLLSALAENDSLTDVGEQLLRWLCRLPPGPIRGE